MGLHLGGGDIASGTGQAASAVAVSPVTCTSLPDSHIAGGVGPLVPCLKLDRVPEPRRRTLWKLRVITWNVGSMTARSKGGDRLLNVFHFFRYTCRQWIPSCF